MRELHIFLRSSLVKYDCLYKRWVDDLYVIISSENDISDDLRARIITQITNSYLPFAMKTEPNDVFVGLDMTVVTADDGSLRDTMDVTIIGKPNMLPHIVSNVSNSTFKGYIKGLLSRLADGSTSELAFVLGFRNVLLGVENAGHSMDTLRQVVFDMGLNFIVFRSIYDEYFAPLYRS